jgi:predicted permease
MDTLLQDLRYTARTLRRSPGFTFMCVLTLALGIGANTAIFSVVNGVILKPLPFPHPEQVVQVAWDWGQGPCCTVTAYQYEFTRDHARSFSGVAAYAGFAAGLGEEDADARVDGMRVSKDFLKVVGFQPELGRGILPAEDEPGGAQVAVISDALWRSRYSADPGVLGRALRMDGTDYTVVGVLPPGFQFPQMAENTDVLTPMRLVADPRDEGHNTSAIARLKPGVTLAQASAEMERVSAGFRATHPELVGSDEQRIGLTSYQDYYVGSGLQKTLWILLGAISLVLLIAGGNVASLLLARASTRQREIAVRTALGAGRRRILRQLLTESVVLALLAAGAGLLLARWGVQALLALQPGQLPRTGEIGLDGRVLAFTVAVALLTGIGFGLAAAMPATRPDLNRSLREGGRGASRGRGRLRGLLVGGEAALSMVLLVGAGLLIATLFHLLNVNTGFDPDGLLTVEFPRTPRGYGSAAQVWNFERQALDRLRAIPGVQDVAAASSLPLERGWNIPMQIEGRPDAAQGDVEWRGVTPGYFETLKVSLRRGRTFREADGTSAPRVVVVNEAFARHFFPGENPIGQRVEIGKFKGEWMDSVFAASGAAEIVGVVADMREMALDRDAKVTMFVPQAQAADRLTTMPALMIRTARPLALRGTVQQALRELDPRLPTPEFRTMERVVGTSVARQRFNASLMAVFAAIALLLTAIGVYGVVSYAVRQRTREIGVRMALGASGSRVVRQVTYQGMLPVVVGLGVGLLAALGLTRLLRSMIWGVSATDPITFAAVAAVLVAVALVASWIPARRATRVDPMVALRAE